MILGTSWQVRQQRYKAWLDKNTKWHNKFFWLPVHLKDGRRAWLCWGQRKVVERWEGSFIIQKYRYIYCLTD